LYGVPFTWWFVVLLAGSMVLLVGAILERVFLWLWIRWLPMIGSLMLAAFVVPGLINLIVTQPHFLAREPYRLLIRAVGTLAIFGCCWVSYLRVRQNSSQYWP
jgi:hypothetical protein